MWQYLNQYGEQNFSGLTVHRQDKITLSLQIQQNETKKHSQSQYCREGGTATSRSLPAMSPLEPNPTMEPGSRSRKGTGPECRKGMVPINMLQPS